ncbi:hypothetical protein FJ930_11570 [Mesorhizobium sp. B2-4-15]|uniref:hypothetical protein n=1 Tax=Mesorhizobium sp. B2-4-15 TaxID=2589934 RepID=UPI001151D14C|nr:hypothetical protein [Mesorhizobium sp. B2-4-15]TPK73119.1 hypothetical protein FJ930_11570 [Mesorhizobium sp. B2-4-15]
MRQVVPSGLLILFALDLSGCVSSSLPDTKKFVAAVSATNSASSVLLDELNVAEKNQFFEKTRASKAYSVRFVAGDSVYHSTLETFAPQTEKFRASIAILVTYANLIQSLASGEDINHVHDSVNAIAMDVSLLAGNPTYGIAVAAFSPIIDRMIAAKDRAELIIVVRDSAPAIHKLINALINSTPQMFEMLQYNAFLGRGNILTQSSSYRLALSNFVVLLDRLESTFDRLFEALVNPTSRPTLDNLASATGELSAYAGLVRQSLATIHSTPK